MSPLVLPIRKAISRQSYDTDPSGTVSPRAIVTTSFPHHFFGQHFLVFYFRVSCPVHPNLPDFTAITCKVTDNKIPSSSLNNELLQGQDIYINSLSCSTSLWVLPLKKTLSQISRTTHKISKFTISLQA